LLIVTGGCLLAFTQEYRASAAMARPSRLLLTATAVVSLLAVSLPYTGAVARAFGFMPLPLPLLIATFLTAPAHPQQRTQVDLAGPVGSARSAAFIVAAMQCDEV